MGSKNVVVTMRLDKNLEILANEENRSLNNMISTIIKKYFDERKWVSDNSISRATNIYKHDENLQM